MATQDPSSREPYTTIEVAGLLGMAVCSVQLMVDRGELNAWKTPGGHRRISRASVERWLAERRGGGKPADGRFALIVTDLMMPGETGLVLLQHLADQPGQRGGQRHQVLRVDAARDDQPPSCGSAPAGAASRRVLSFLPQKRKAPSARRRTCPDCCPTSTPTACSSTRSSTPTAR